MKYVSGAKPPFLLSLLPFVLFLDHLVRPRSCVLYRIIFHFHLLFIPFQQCWWGIGLQLSSLSFLMLVFVLNAALFAACYRLIVTYKFCRFNDHLLSKLATRGNHQIL